MPLVTENFYCVNIYMFLAAYLQEGGCPTYETPSLYDYSSSEWNR